MNKRFVSIWLKHLTTDEKVLHLPELKEKPFVLSAPERGRKIIKAASVAAENLGITPGMVVADARVITPELVVLDAVPGAIEKILYELAEWCIRYTPIVATDPPDGLVLDISGCAHLWGGERAYLKDIGIKLKEKGYDIRAAIADTIGVAWAVSRYGTITPIIPSGIEAEALYSLPPAALRLEPAIVERMHKLGFYQLQQFINMPRPVLRRRFGITLLERIDQATGAAIENIIPIKPPVPYQERLPCLEPIRTAKGIEIALKNLLETICKRLRQEGMGLRGAVFSCYRVDGNIQQISIGTNRASRNMEHLFKLFELKIPGITPALGFELFMLEATVTEEISIEQEVLWHTASIQDITAITELLDKIAGRAGMSCIHRYLPDEHHWPERSIKLSTSLEEMPAVDWRTDISRPVHLLAKPEIIEVTVRLPDYPPMLFKYKGQLHHVKKADGPERLEQEWWLQTGEHRDYYTVEDQHGARYWLFRSGHYNEQDPKWYLHGFFA